MSTIKDRLPGWVEQQGGQDRWAKWVKNRAASCHSRAKKWKRRTNTKSAIPKKKDWTQAIIAALSACNGTGAYSGWTLDVALPATSPLYPSVDHVAGLGAATARIETRLINDMKTILNEAEFKQVIGHLASVLGAAAAPLSDGWKPKRDFSGPEGRDEPPL